MTDPRLFDSFANEYDLYVNEAISVSGETAEFFADLKVSLAKEICATSHIQTILDFGCGIGNTTRLLAIAFPMATIVGCDASEASLSAARRLNENPERIEYCSTRRSTLPFDDRSFDLIFVSCVFHHIEPAQRQHWARELHRVTNANGHLIVFEHNPLNPFTQRVVRDCPFDRGVVLLRSSEANRLLRNAGYRTNQPQFYFFFPRALKALRPLERHLRRIPIGAQYFVVGRVGLQD